MALDTSIPVAGREVFAVGFASMEVLDQEVKSDGFETGVVQRRVALRRGVITDVHLQGHRVSWPCFETTIPTDGGMSGGPVYWLPDGPGTTAAVCGMISKDFSPQEAWESYHVAGCSTAALMYPALGQRFGGAETKAAIREHDDEKVTVYRVFRWFSDNLK